MKQRQKKKCTMKESKGTFYYFSFVILLILFRFRESDFLILLMMISNLINKKEKYMSSARVCRTDEENCFDDLYFLLFVIQ